MPVHNARTIQVVRRELDPDSITGQDANTEPAHLPGHMTEHDAVHVVELDAKHRVRQGLDNFAFELDFLFLGHCVEIALN